MVLISEDDLRSALAEAIATHPTYTATSLARAIGRDGTYIRDYLSGKKRTLGAAEISELEDRLRLSLRPGHAFEPRKPRANAGPILAIKPARSDRIPVYGSAVGGYDGRFEMNGNRIADVFTPSSLVGVPDAYAVYVHGNSMEPRYHTGETVWVNPHRPVRQGDYVVAQIMAETEGDAPLGFIKKFVSRSPSQLVLEQLNPPNEDERLMCFDGGLVVSVHKIVFAGES